MDCLEHNFEIGGGGKSYFKTWFIRWSFFMTNPDREKLINVKISAPIHSRSMSTHAIAPVQDVSDAAMMRKRTACTHTHSEPSPTHTHTYSQVGLWKTEFRIITQVWALMRSEVSTSLFCWLFPASTNYNCLRQPYSLSSRSSTVRRTCRTRPELVPELVGWNVQLAALVK